MDPLLTARATTLVTEGYKVRLDAATHVVLARQVKVNHIAHFILTIFTAFLIFPFWLLVWLLMFLNRKEELYTLDAVNGKVEGRAIGAQRKQRTIDL